jgi:hypothetical protein
MCADTLQLARVHGSEVKVNTEDDGEQGIK